ncbi:hypothetical protein L2331_07070 [Mesorhizobium muleiense]|nr:hypothetical protein [Mesorhizobium muleiense]MCF6109682.1 hypothetical protein [Mesorhizobium muleiense]
MTGFVVSGDAVWGRPAGVAVAIAEDGSGCIWRVTCGRGCIQHATPRIFSNGRLACAAEGFILPGRDLVA